MKCPHHNQHPTHHHHHQQHHHHHPSSVTMSNQPSQHYHHHQCSFASSSGVSSSVSHHHHHHHQNHHHPTTCGPSSSSTAPSTTPGANGAFPGSQTLPMALNGGQFDSTSQCQYGNGRTRTLPNGTNSAPFAMSDQFQNSTQWWYLSPRTTGLFFLSLVFILIWSSVISGILLNRSYREQDIALHTAKLTELHRDIGQFAFAIGQEMLYSVNTSISLLDQSTSLPERNTSEDINNTSSQPLSLPPLPEFTVDSVRLKMNQTDRILEQVAANLATKGYVDFESDVQSQVDKLRSICVHQVVSQWKSFVATTTSNNSGSTALFPILFDCVRSFQHSFHTLDNLLLKDTNWMNEKLSKVAMTDLAIRSQPYTLFIRGVVHRFTTLGMGLILVKSNFSHSFNMSEYFHHYYSSRQLFLSSFSWNYRHLQRHLEIERDFQEDMLVNFFDARRLQEHDFYLQMSAIFGRMFSLETLSRIRNYIKKKNVESVERVMGNGSSTKFVAEDSNRVSFNLNIDLLEMMGLENIEKVSLDHQQMLNTIPSTNLWLKYDQLMRNQIGFMSRVQDFLSNYIAAPAMQLSMNEQNNLLYHSVVVGILILGVLFCLALLLCTYCCARVSTCGGQCGVQSCGATVPPLSVTQGTLGRRMRRRLWNLSSPFSLFKSCFSSPFSSPTSPPRYPLLYKSNHHMHYQPHNSPNSQLISSHTASRQCSVPYCASSPNSFLHAKRNLCGGLINRYMSSGTANGNITKNAAAVVPYKSDKSQSANRRSNGKTLSTTETTSLMAGDQSATVNLTATTSRSSCHSSCCMSCPPHNTGQCNEVVMSCEAEDSNSCSKCAATGKCPTCCPYNRSDEDSLEQPLTASTTKKSIHSVSLQHRKRASSKDSKQSDLTSSTLSVLSESKDSTRSSLTNNTNSIHTRETSSVLDQSDLGSKTTAIDHNNSLNNQFGMIDD